MTEASFLEPFRILALSVVGAHFVLLGLLSLFGLHRFYLVGLRIRHRKFVPQTNRTFANLPTITVQVPLYNETQVAERIINAVAALNYPHDRLQIQILDDSTDETTSIVMARVSELTDLGIPIECHHRSHRTGFKAGALAAGLEKARGEFVAIFDADFIPGPDFLLNVVPYLADPDVAVVQTRWSHLNRHVNSLTEVQALRLDAHFSVEQTARSAAGLHFNFNGTAGIWRTSAIFDAGGWQGDTLTEDLDLSYRAQLRGWRFVFLPTQDCPGELPTDLRALEAQQHRWAKGATQVLMKLAPSIWRSSRRFGEKLESTFHLAGNLAYLVMMIDTVIFLVPSLIAREAFGWQETLWVDAPLLLLSTGGQLCFFVAGQWASGRSVPRAIRLLPALLATGVGVALNDARAVLEALRGHKSEFVRTPKSGGMDRLGLAPDDVSPVPPESITHHDEGLGDSVARNRLRSIIRRPELLVGLAYGLVTLWAVLVGLWLAVPFLLLLHVGFLGNGIRRLREFG